MEDHVHTAGDTEPVVAVPTPIIYKQPVAVLVGLAVLTEAGGAVVLLANEQTLTGVLVAVGTFLTGLAGVLARQLVTPLADPHDDEGDPLVAVPTD